MNIDTEEEKNFNEIFSHHYASLKDVTVHYVQGGEGEPLLLIHGAFQTWREWKKIMPKLAESYQIIAIDIRGLGDSSKPANGYEMRNVADDCYQLIRQLGISKLRIAGHDLGGGIAYAFAAAHPEMVQSFAFLDMLIPGFGFEEAWIPRPDGQFLWFAALNAVPGLVEKLLVGREEAYLRSVLGSFTTDPNAISVEDMNDYIRAYSLPGTLQALGGYFRAMWLNFEHNRENAKQKVTMPALALGGQFSTGDMAANSLRCVAENVQSVVIEKVGHWLVDEKPESVLKALLTFFNKH